MTGKFNKNAGGAKDEFQDFLSALSGQKQSAPVPAKLQPGKPALPSLARPPVKGGITRKEGLTPQEDTPLMKGPTLPKRPLSPQPTPPSREAIRTVPAGHDENSTYLMGTREKSPIAPIASETAFLPREEDMSRPIGQPRPRPTTFLPVETEEETIKETTKTEKGADTKILPVSQEKLSATPQKKELDKGERITLSHVTIRPQFSLEQLIETMIREGATDLHIATSCIPSLRINGEIMPLELPDLDLEFSENLLMPILSEEQRSVFEEEGDLDFSYDYLNKARFRVSYYRHYGGIGAAFRHITLSIPTPDQLGLPKVIKNLVKFRKGLVLVTGPSGNGKSSTIASMLDEINHTQKVRIITLEKPIEYILKNDLGLISQREIGMSAISYTDALWAVLREDPDVIMVSELWESEDIRQVLKISETGHLVIAAINTVDCAKAVERLVNAFPLDEHDQVCIMVSESLVGVIAQRLMPRADGRGRVLAAEILLSTTGLATIIRDGKFFQIPSIIQTGRNLGMQTMDQALLELIEKKLITPQAAKIIATDDRFFRRAGIRFDD